MPENEQKSFEIKDPAHNVFWKIDAIARKTEQNDVVVELQWGWTAGMSEEDLKNCADDAPQGYEYVKTTLEMAKQLRDDLNKIIEQYELPKATIIWRMAVDGEFCAVCGKQMSTTTGYNLATVKHTKYICSECGNKHYPELMTEMDRMSFD